MCNVIKKTHTVRKQLKQSELRWLSVMSVSFKETSHDT